MKTRLILATLVVVGFSLAAQANNMPDCTNPNGQVTTFNTVPDGGTTAMLLGGALAGLGLVKRKFWSK
jgi:VPDSG-CTERM motif